MSEATELRAHVRDNKWYVDLTSTEDAILQEFISGTWASYTWRDVVRLITDKPYIIKVLFEYMKHLDGLVQNEKKI